MRLKLFSFLLIPMAVMVGFGTSCASIDAQNGVKSDGPREEGDVNEVSSATAVSSDDEQNRLGAEVLWKMSRIGSPVISPDGKWVVAPVTRYSVEDDQSHTDLWLFASDGSIERPLTRHGSAEGQPAFSPDGSKLVFVSRRDEDDASQLYMLPVSEPGEAQRLAEIPTGVDAPKWIGEHIYFISRVWPEKTWSEMKEKLEEEDESHVSARVWNELPYSHWDHWLDEERQAHVYRVSMGDAPFNRESGKRSGVNDAKSGNAKDDKIDRQKKNSGGTLISLDHVEPVTLPTGRELPRSTQGLSSYDVAPDESLVAFVSDTNHDDTDPKMDIYLVIPGSEDTENITLENGAPDSNPLFSPDGSTIAYNRQQIKGFYGDIRRLVLYDVDGGEHREIAAEWDRSADGLVWAPDGSTLYGTIDDAGTRRIYAIDTASGEPKALTTDTDYLSLDFSETGLLVGTNQSFLHPPRLVIIDPGDGNTRRLDSLNDEILADVELGTYESVTYEGYDGEEIQMWVQYPPGFDENREYPLFLLIHGGPHSGITDGFHFRWNAQTFASWGYVTAWHNFHGSSGFGQEFTDAINPDWITKPYTDTRKAADWFAGQSWIDEERMVAGGGSYGGYLSSILLGKEHPFNTLLIHAPVYNMYSQMASDFAVHTTRYGDYWEHDIYEEISPHYYAESFDTPALIIHGQLDYRVPVGQSFELFRTLQHRGIDSRLVYFSDENHWILKPNNSLKWYEEVRKWMTRYAEPGPQ